ncbi:MAG: hypothetical protein IH802_12715 [Nitrospinae bacterium]|nr:hypothetical protein [Nitrospinota bacterium]
MNGKAQNKTRKDPFEGPFNYAEYQNFIKIKKAKAGDTTAAKEILEQFCDWSKEGTRKESLITDSIEIPVSFYRYFVMCSEPILNQLINNEDPDANKAFNLTTSEPGRREDPEILKRNQEIRLKIIDKVSKKNMILKEAIYEVAGELKLSTHTVKRIWEKIHQRWLNDD